MPLTRQERKENMSTRNKNANGQGTIFYRDRDKRWVVQVTDPLTGKRVTRTTRVQKESKQILREMLNRIDEGKPAVDVTKTVTQFTEAWLKGQAGKRRAPTTVNEYGGRLRRYVTPVIGHKRMDRITPHDVEDLLDLVVAQGLSKGTVKAVKNALSAMFSDAKKARLIARNPVQDAEMPFMQSKAPKEYPTTQEVQELLKLAATVEGDPARELGRILLMCAHTGARIGEILATKWKDLDLEKQRWNLVATLTRDDEGRGELGSRTKTGEARQVQLTAPLVEALKIQREYVAYVRSMSGNWGEEDFVFPTSIGTFKNQNNVYKILRISFPDWAHTFHDLRHWFVSTGFQSGASAVQIARLVGHKDVRTTTDIYGHILDEGKDQIVNAVQQALEN
jgi:integrase